LPIEYVTVLSEESYPLVSDYFSKFQVKLYVSMVDVLVRIAKFDKENFLIFLPKFRV